MKAENNTIASGFSGYMMFIVIFTIIVLVASLFYARKLFLQYDPEPVKWAGEGKPIGGWLLLLALGLILGPVLNIMNFFGELNFFNSSLWERYLAPGSLFYSPKLAVILLLEMAFNIAFIVYAVLCLILFLMRRTSAPRMIIILYIIAVTFPLIDHLILYLFTDEAGISIGDVDIKQLFRAGIAAAIWIPYLSFSDTVKETFSRQRTRRKLSEEPKPTPS